MNYKRTLLTSVLIFGVTRAYAMDPHDAKPRADNDAPDFPCSTIQTAQEEILIFSEHASSPEKSAGRKTDIDQRVKQITAGIEALTNYDPRISSADYELLGEAVSNLDKRADPLEPARPSIWFSGTHGKSFWIAPLPKIPLEQINQEGDILGTLERDSAFDLAKKNPDADTQAYLPSRKVFTYKLRHGRAEKISNTLNMMIEHERSRKPRFRKPEPEEKVFKSEIEIESINENNLQVTATLADYEILVNNIKALDVRLIQVYTEPSRNPFVCRTEKDSDREYEANCARVDEMLIKAYEQLQKSDNIFTIDAKNPSKDTPLAEWFIGK